MKIPFKGTVSKILCDLSCKDGNARFTIQHCPLKALSYQDVYLVLKTHYFQK